MELSESSSSVSPNLDLHIGNSNEIDQVQLNHSDIGPQQYTAADQQLDNHSGGDAAVSHSSPGPDVDVVYHAVVDEIERLDLIGDDVAVEAAAAEVEEKKEEGEEVEAEEKGSNGGGGEIEYGNESERQSEEEESNEGENRRENGGEGEKKGGEYNRRYQYPVRPEAEDCSFYLKTGNCKFGSNCRFNHPVRRKNNQVFKSKVKEKDELSEKPSQTECKYYLRPGGCKYGKACRHNHGKGKPSVAPVVELNFLGLPIRRGERECPYYMRNGSCKYGSNCRFNHPDPTAAGGSDPPSGFDNGGPASLQGGSQSSSWSAPRSLNETPLYMPMMMPPSQGVPSQNTEWNGYQAPVYLERSMPARPPYVINNSGTKTNVDKQYPPSNQVDEFRERPGQRLCSFFLRTGDCKFKSNCKYHHPKSQTAVSPSFALSDKGLPLRPLRRAGRYVRMEEPIGEYCCPVQIIDSDGDFKNAGLDRFVEQAKLGECGASYVVASIIGAQSSGKSTLMNHLFGTGFTEMDINKRRCQTTKGIWIAKCAGIEPCTLAMDVEGTDGRERGEDDTFERQSALFALAISDIVLINMWCHDLGREHAANKPLLRTIFEVKVMMHSFDPARKTTLIFILRDKTKVEVVALSSYEDKEKEFQEEVAQLKQRFINSTAPGGLASGDRTGVLPASEFSHYAQEIWTQIKKNRDLDIASHKKSIAAFRCEEIANEKFMQLSVDENWLALETTVQTDLVRAFSGKLSSILNIYISGYDKETEYFDKLIRNSKRHQLLVTKALDLIRPAYAIMLRHLHSEALENFKIRLVRSLVRLEGFASSVIAHSESCMREFDQACADASIDAAINSNGNAYGVLEEKSKRELKRDIEAYSSSQVDEQMLRFKLDCERQLWEALSLNDPIAALLLEGDDDIWSKKRGLLHDAIELVDERFSNEFNGYALDQGRSAEMLQILRDYARRVAEEKPRQEATRVLIHMVNRFLQAFNYDSDANARTWTVEVDIRIIIRNARYESLKILSTLAAIRLDETQDDIERVLSSTLIDGEISSTTLDSVNWDMVSSNNTLITPLECQSLWRQFKEETTHAVVQTQETQRQNNSPNDVPNDDAPNFPEFKPYMGIIAVIIGLLSAYGIPNAASFVPEILGLLLPRLRSQALTLPAIFLAVKKFAEAYRNWRSHR